MCTKELANGVCKGRLPLLPQDACSCDETCRTQHQIINIINTAKWIDLQHCIVWEDPLGTHKKKQKPPEKSRRSRACVSGMGFPLSILVHTSVHLYHCMMSSCFIKATFHQWNVCQYLAHPKDTVTPNFISALLYKELTSQSQAENEECLFSQHPQQLEVVTPLPIPIPTSCLSRSEKSSHHLLLPPWCIRRCDCELNLQKPWAKISLFSFSFLYQSFCLSSKKSNIQLLVTGSKIWV